MGSCASSNEIEKDKREKTVFQTSQPWKPTIDIRSDVALVYSVKEHHGESDMTFEERVQSWRDRGYTTHFMTGIAWGEYQDYFTGEWDGTPHLDEGQVTQEGDTLWHGEMVPYIVPTENFIEYIKETQIKRVIDAGIDAIYLEEPEFWMRAGYSEAFKREWEDYYGFEWRPQHESPENTYLSNQLKYHLYYRALEECFTYAKEYGKTKGMDVRCYVPTHSLVNYSQWQIVSPEASLASLSAMDGYIAQVWTGTAREPNYYNGEAKERVFETAFLEYGSMESMTAPTGRKMFFLTDPIEDWGRDWMDYKKNYQATFIAQLLYPNISNYEVMPWPNRIYEGRYKVSADSDERAKIPDYYATQVQVMINVLNEMPASDNKVSGSGGVSVLMSNSLMFQRFPTHDGYDDPQLANFYGQTLPLLKRGVPVKTLHLENVSYEETFKDTKVLVMSYSGMKPLTPEGHTHIAEWVENGGQLIYCGRDIDPFQTVQGWWNTDDHDYEAPSEHLFEMMGVESVDQTGKYEYGDGDVYIVRQDPKEFVLEKDNDTRYVDIVREMYESAGSGTLNFKNSLFLERGPYDMVAVMDEGVNDEPFVVDEPVIDLFDSELPVLSQKTVQPGEQALLFNLGRIEDPKKPQVLATAARISEEENGNSSYSFVAKSPANTTNSMRILLPEEPEGAVLTLDGQEIADFEQSWDAGSNTCFLSFENFPDGVRVEVNW
ncbi:MAG: hypothetical protein ACQER7_02470 [Bacteroidota bacterium]